MKRYLASAIITLALAGVARADLTVRLFNGYGSGPGGEFDVRVMDGSKASSFLESIPLKTRTQSTPREFGTFCIEKSEFIGFNTTYLATLSDSAFNGGFGNGQGVDPGSDPLSPQTAYLYTQFANGLLGGYNYGTQNGAFNPGRENNADALQQVIWWFENEINPDGPHGYDSYNPLDPVLANENLGGQAYDWWLEAVNAGWTDIGNVRVLNLWDMQTGESHQSQLIIIPAPGAVVLTCLGLGAVGWYRRRK